MTCKDDHQDEPDSRHEGRAEAAGQPCARLPRKLSLKTSSGLISKAKKLSRLSSCGEENYLDLKRFVSRNILKHFRHKWRLYKSLILIS